MSRNGQGAYQLNFKGIAPPNGHQSYRQLQIARRKWRVANRERLRHLPFTEAEESVRKRR